MRVVDTSAWIEWLTASPTGRSIEDQLPDRQAWVVPTIVQLELSKWLWREFGEDKAYEVMAFTQLCIVVPLSTTIALLAADIFETYKLATADSIIYATAIEHGVDLLTCNAHFSGLSGVNFFAKVTA